MSSVLASPPVIVASSIRVEDEGPGVSADDVERIFDIYVTKPGEESRGLGLGLPLSRRLARLLGGELHAVVAAGKGRLLRSGGSCGHGK